MRSTTGVDFFRFLGKAVAEILARVLPNENPATFSFLFRPALRSLGEAGISVNQRRSVEVFSRIEQKLQVTM